MDAIPIPEEREFTVIYLSLTSSFFSNNILLSTTKDLLLLSAFQYSESVASM